MGKAATSKSPLASDVIKEAIRQCSQRTGREITYRDLAQTLGMSPSSMWFPIKRDRAWVVDRWLVTLQALGCLSFQGDHIIITSPKFLKYEEIFNQIDQL